MSCLRTASDVGFTRRGDGPPVERLLAEHRRRESAARQRRDRGRRFAGHRHPRRPRTDAVPDAMQVVPRGPHVSRGPEQTQHERERADPDSGRERGPAEPPGTGGTRRRRRPRPVRGTARAAGRARPGPPPPAPPRPSRRARTDAAGRVAPRSPARTASRRAPPARRTAPVTGGAPQPGAQAQPEVTEEVEGVLQFEGKGNGYLRDPEAQLPPPALRRRGPALAHRPDAPAARPAREGAGRPSGT